MEKIIGLKEFRENVNQYAKKVHKGQSFVVVKRSKPLFKMVPVEFETEEGIWETVVDFNNIHRGGLPAETLLKYLQHGQNKKSSKKAKR